MVVSGNVIFILGVLRKLSDIFEIFKMDVVVIGVGIGGFCCVVLFVKYGYKVVVCESYDIVGGVGYVFEW